jgi:hypothetical protein
VIYDHPENAYYRRFVPVMPEFVAIRGETWDYNNLGYAIRGATPRARIDVRCAIPGTPLVALRDRPLTIRTRVENLSTRHLPARATYGRRLVRLGAQLCSADGSMLNRDFARADLPGSIGPGQTAEVPILLPSLGETGRYALKFDLVNEGVDWFERCGSETTTRPLWVVN